MAATVSAPVPESDAFTDGGDVAADEITETIEIRSASGKTKQISMPEPSDEDETATMTGRVGLAKSTHLSKKVLPPHSQNRRRRLTSRDLKCEPIGELKALRDDCRGPLLARRFDKRATVPAPASYQPS